MTLVVLRNTGHVFVECPSTGILLMFFSQLDFKSLRITVGLIELKSLLFPGQVRAPPLPSIMRTLCSRHGGAMAAG